MDVSCLVSRQKMLQVVLALCMLSLGLRADINEDMPKAIVAMKAEKWEEAHAILERVVAQYGGRAGVLGDKFGRVFYDKGRIEMKMAAQLKIKGGEGNVAKSEQFYQKAVKSLTECRKFPEGKKFGEALLFRGRSKQALGQFKEAIQDYEGFLKNATLKSSQYEQGKYRLDMALCLSNLPDPKPKEARRFLDLAISAREEHPISDYSIRSAFMHFSAAAIQKNDEKILLGFLNKHRSAITIDSYKMYRFGAHLQKLAYGAFEKDQIKEAFALYALTSEITAIRDDLAARVKSVKGCRLSSFSDSIFKTGGKVYVDRMRQDYTSSIIDAELIDPPEMLAMRSMAYTFEVEGYLRGAFAVYERLERDYPKSKSHEENLYGVVRVLSELKRAVGGEGPYKKVKEYAKKFVRLYPESEYLPAVQCILIYAYFYSDEYEKSLNLSSQLLFVFKKQTEFHDFCLQVYAGSLYYTGQFFEAQRPITQHLKMYPKSKYRQDVRYYEASNTCYLELYERGAEKLDAFLKDYPNQLENIYTSHALYDRASCHFALEEYRQAIDLLDRVITQFPKSEVIDLAKRLRNEVRAEVDKEKE